MSETTRDFVRSVYTFDAVVQRVPTDMWDVDSPCEGWSARDVLRHQCGVLDALSKVIQTGEMAPPGMAEEADNPTQRWAQTRDELLTSLEIPGALAVEGAYWFGPMTVEALVGMVQWDPLTHAWDIGSVTGIAPHMPEDLLEKSLSGIKAIEEMARNFNLIAPAIDVPADAPMADRFIGFLGRQP